MLQNNAIKSRLATRYLIKAGGKGPKGNPVKWNHFKICANDQDRTPQTEWMVEHFGTPEPTEIPFMFFSNEPQQCYDDGYSYRTRSQRLCYSYDGKVAFWSKKSMSDGKAVTNTLPKEITRMEGKANETEDAYLVHCPGPECPMQKTNKCKINLRLVGFIPKPEIDEGFVFEGADLFYSSSYNSAAQLRASMDTLIALTGGKIAFEPLKLRIQPKKAMVSGKEQTVYIVSFFPTRSVSDIQTSALASGQRQETKLTAIPAAVDFGDDHDIQEEFYPEADEGGVQRASLEDMMPHESEWEDDDSPPVDAYDDDPDVEVDEEPSKKELVSPEQQLKDLKARLRKIGVHAEKSEGIIKAAIEQSQFQKHTMAERIEGLQELCDAWEKIYGVPGDLPGF